MVKIVGVRFRSSGKTYYFDPGDFEIRSGANVIVETVRGIEFGTVAGNPREVTEEEILQPLRPILRMATEEDVQRAARNREKEREAMSICREKIRKHDLEMKLIDAEYTFDNNKILFYFTADGRIDFRELVKDLASVFRTRIELRQIGVRDETKILGGIGICGRPLCCHTYLSDFVPVSIKMAKEQNLSLNPTKISGVCGRLMCCLKNEEDTYEYLNSKLPAIGETVMTPSGIQGEVSSVNVLRQKVKVMIEVDDEKELHEYDVEELRFRPKKKKEKKEKPEHAEKAHSDKANPDSSQPEQRQRGEKRHAEKGSEERRQKNPAADRQQKQPGEYMEEAGRTSAEYQDSRDSQENAENQNGKANGEKRRPRRRHRSHGQKQQAGGPGQNTHSAGSAAGEE